MLHVQSNADLYGASRMLLRWLKQVDRNRFEPLVVLQENGPLKDLIEKEHIEVILHPRMSVITRQAFKAWHILSFLRNYPFSVLFLWRLIRRRRIELVYSNTGVILSAALAARLAGVPHVWHMREWFQEFQTIWPAFSWYIRKFSCKIIAISRAVASQFEPPGSAVVVHDGISMDEFPVLRETMRKRFRSAYGLGEDFVVGCVGRIKLVRKGQEVLVQAAGLLKQRGRPIKALIVGAPFRGNESHLARLQEMARQLGIVENVVFTGELADTCPAYAGMDVFTLTSVQPEPLGDVVMEAMAMERPVIATNIGGPLDTVEPGKTGLLVAPGDPAALADAIEQLMGDPDLRLAMGKAGAERIRNQFSVVEMAQKLEQLFEEAIATR
ncbi:MAG: glycosyltransferase [Candidatus Omnitrophica bacterium]|nr:glycosyltransferase [Candidatus Omnitrophota bacterium]